MNEHARSHKHRRIRRDHPDERDHVHPTRPHGRSVDLRQHLFDIEHQRDSRACGGFAASTIVEILFRRHRPDEAVELSPLFAWWNARAYAGDTHRNEGVSARMLLKGLHQRGICPEAVWKFGTSKYRKPPPRTAFKVAKQLRIRSYERCTDPKSIKSALTAGLPVLLGMTIREGLEGISGPLHTHPAQFTAYRTRPERIPHFMVIAGYRPGGAIVVNSWGPDYHDRGCLLIPWDILMQDSWDIWVMTGIHTWLEEEARSFRELQSKGGGNGRRK